LPTLASLACSTTGATLVESAQLDIENRRTTKEGTMIGLWILIDIFFFFIFSPPHQRIFV
jgi:hypothetical protein